MSRTIPQAEVVGAPVVAIGEYRGLSLDVNRRLRVTGVGGTFTVAGTATPSDAFPNPTDAVTTWSLQGGWDGATWRRQRVDTPSDAFANPVGALTGWALQGGWDGATWRRQRVDTPSDAFANPAGANTAWSLQGGFDPTTGWRRIQADGNGSERQVQADPSLTNAAPMPSAAQFVAVAATGLIKAAPGKLLAIRYNTTAVLAVSFFQLFNKAAVPVLGDVPIFSFIANRLAALPITLDRSFFGPSGGMGTIGLSWGLSSTAGTFTAAVPIVAQFVSAVFV